MNRQPEGMSPPAIRPALSQPANIIEHLAAQVILDPHLGQRGVQIQDLLVGQVADFAGRVDVHAGEEVRRDVLADAEEVFHGFLGVG
jgi:hypothetical protein